MTSTRFTQTRRGAVAAALALASGVASIARDAQAEPAAGGGSTGEAPTGHEHDWDWLVGRWAVRHHQLKDRLAGSTEWIDFDGTSALWLTLGGLGTVDDNVLHKPTGTYRAVGVRAFDPKDGKWSIWWLDGRNPTDLGVPVRGGFAGGVGTFEGDDTLDGRPIRVRFRWTDITPTSARWEQAFSPDAGATWEVNWVMRLTRTAASPG